MKKLLLVVFILSALNYSCSKEDQSTGRTPLPPLKEYSIDLNFAINDSCSINNAYLDDYGDYELDSRDFYLSAFSASNLPNVTSRSFINVDQSYFYYNEKYSIPKFEIYEEGQNGTPQILLIMQPDTSDFNFFTLPCQNDSASFSGTCHITQVTERYLNAIRKTVPLKFSGFIDTLHYRGSIRIKGSIYL